MEYLRLLGCNNDNPSKKRELKVDLDTLSWKTVLKGIESSGATLMMVLHINYKNLHNYLFAIF